MEPSCYPTMPGALLRLLGSRVGGALRTLCRGGPDDGRRHRQRATRWLNILMGYYHNIVYTIYIYVYIVCIYIYNPMIIIMESYPMVAKGIL